ncbi:MAG: YcgN family cysteine cluster protein [Xanthomonadaceae bacterium]|nr:YcgN family cysteine cluster protein [Xanthomonadaceae bacterium]
MNPEKPFWERKTLEEMTPAEWESLCDGCARCCLFKLEDEDSGEIFFTNVVCRYLDQGECRCPDIAKENWLPTTCAYRLLAEGKPLPAWHPLRTGSEQSVWDAGICIAGMAVSELEVEPDELEEHLIHWDDMPETL